MTLALGLALAALASPVEAAPPESAREAAARERAAELAALPDAPGLRPGDRAALAAALAGLGPPPAPAGPAPSEWAARLWDWFLDLLGTPEAERYASGGRLAFLGVLAAAAFAASWVLLRPRKRAAKAPAARPTASAAPTDPGKADARAEDALGRARPREALRLAFLAALEALESAGHLPRCPGLTNRELSRELAGRASAPAEAEAEWHWLVRRHDLAVYGNAPVGEAEAREALSRSRTLRRWLLRSPA